MNLILKTNLTTYLILKELNGLEKTSALFFIKSTFRFKFLSPLKRIQLLP